ncbi:hypothetical protein A0128_05295 [Leptospira tipperaryensis]|uniref:Uncharacterized protein n=1 Tax=Leptospira tipperaryensis TaxID=2564040 RepID=A0A1D7UUN6_9LEPT|nr:hypothetical protein [Leptospira tipperaryensis]AOP33312.1 hypothetical protein A0128_05295 [Leptospira tipperaryensis]
MKYFYFVDSIAILLIGFYFNLEAQYIGFPSAAGGATELERAQRPLFYQYSYLCFCTGVALLIISFKTNGSRWRNYLRIGILFLFFVLSAIVYGIELKYVSTLRGGEGG